jgi:hypothetical protein
VFETHGPTGNTFSLVSLISTGLGIGFVPEWTKDLPNRNFVLCPAGRRSGRWHGGGAVIRHNERAEDLKRSFTLHPF